MYVHIYKNNPTAGLADGAIVSETVLSALAMDSGAGSLTIKLVNTIGFYAKLGIVIGAESAVIASVDYATSIITLTSGLSSSHSTGEKVINADAGSNPITCNPLSITVGEESASIKLSLRCEAGYKTSGDTTIAPVGTTKNQWALSIDGVTWLAWGATLTISAEITAVNKIFYAKAKSITGEIVANDVSVDFNVVGKVLAV